jgi:DNA repair protein RecN (Recombination protein N)
MNSEKIATSLSGASEKASLAVDTINEAIKAIEKISNLDSKYDKKLSELKNIYYEIDELSRDVSDMNEDVYFNENDRNEVEERLDLISTLRRKYGNSIDEILDYKAKIQNEIERINNLDETNKKLKEELAKLEDEMKIESKSMHIIRNDVARILDEKIYEQLKDLEMPNAKFFTRITNKAEEFNRNGLDQVEFFISTNIGEDEKELSKVASGGEMSRLMLAIKTVLADTDNTPVLIFDEIDTGISGKAAKSVAQKLKLIGKSHQVLCITHQPSIAAKGDNNFYISKIAQDNRTHTIVKKLNEEEIIDEIARISNGDITDIAKRHAIELRKSA